MWFSNKVHSAVSFMKIKGLEKASDTHYWEVEWEKIESNVFSWRLIKIANSSYEFEWKEKSTIKMLFADNGENYQLDISFNSISRWLINTILWYIDEKKSLGATKGKLDLEISLYMNKENYKSMGLYINGERGNWRMTYDEQKTLIEDIKNSKWEVLQRDFSWLDEVLKKWVEEIQDFIDINDFQEPIVEKEKFNTYEFDDKNDSDSVVYMEKSWNK